MLQDQILIEEVKLLTLGSSGQIQTKRVDFMLCLTRNHGSLNRPTGLEALCEGSGDDVCMYGSSLCHFVFCS